MNRVLLIDSNAVFRLGLCSLVRTAQPALIVSEAETFALGCAILRQQHDIALVILDIDVPDGSGFLGLVQLRSEFPDVPVVMLSGTSQTEQESRAMTFGAAGLIRRSSPCDAILQSLKTVLAGESEPAPIISRTDEANPITSLSPALMRVLMGVKRGLRNKEIAFELGLSEKTIKAYLGSLYRKLGVSNRTQAVILMQQVLAET